MTPTKASVTFHIDYQQISPIKNLSCDVMLPLYLTNEKWIINFQKIDPTCNTTDTKMDNEADPHLPPIGKNLPVESQPEPKARQPQIHTAEPQPLPPLSDRPAAGDVKPRTLLDTWTFNELQGQPGDERIVKVTPPNYRPPQQTQPDEMLPQLDARRFNSIRRVNLPEGKKLVALTFDLCEQADDRTGYDRSIVNTLREQRISATFFAGGKWMRSHEDKALQLMADPNFEIGNHAWTHGNLRVLKGQKMLDQIVWTQAEYQRIWDILKRRAEAKGLSRQMEKIPRQPLTLRFPYGTCSAESLRAANEMGLNAIQWDVVSGDAAAGVTPDELTRRIIKYVHPGSIIVFHANGRGHGTAAALPGIISGLKEKGFSFMTVSKLLNEGVPETESECYELKPGDNRRYDALFGEGTQ